MPVIVIVTGCPCSGKTTVCRELSKKGFRQVGIDQFFEYGKSKYDPDNSRQAYDKMFKSLEKENIVIDTPGNAPAFKEARKRLTYYTTVKIEASWDSIQERYRSRWQANDIPPWKLKQDFDEIENVQADFIVNSDDYSPSEIAELILRFLQKREDGIVGMDLHSPKRFAVKDDFLDELME